MQATTMAEIGMAGAMILLILLSSPAFYKSWARTQHHRGMMLMTFALLVFHISHGLNDKPSMPTGLIVALMFCVAVFIWGCAFIVRDQLRMRKEIS